MKKTLLLFLKNLGFLFFLATLQMSGQSRVSTIYTDWGGYWKSTGTTGVGNRPDNENTLLAFEWNGKTYSTGVNDNVFNGKPVAYSPQKFRALKIQTLGLDPSMYFLQGSKIDGYDTTAKLTPALAGSTSTGAELASRLTDGVKGLTLGTGIANIKPGTAEFKIGTDNLNLDGLGDTVPDLLVTQVADPAGATDTFKFVDKFNNIVGHAITVNFSNVTPVGTYSLDLFRADNGAMAYSPASTRDIRILGLETSEFGITRTNAADVDRFVITFSGSSDCAFIAFNTSSLKIAELSMVKKATLASCGKAGDIINYSYEITNTGEVPLTDVQITNLMPGMTITGNPIGNLGIGAKTTITGTYVITNADVAAGKAVNTVKVIGTDPSLNTVEDDVPLETILLAAPTIGTITNISCSALGSVILNNLPDNVNWTIVNSTGSITKSGTGTSTTISNLPVGNYTFKVSTITGCNSIYSTNVNISDQSATKWDGTSWSKGLPDATKNTIIAGPLTITSDFSTCSCTINPGISITIPSDHTLTVVNGLSISPTSNLIFENNASLIQVNTANNINTGNITYKRSAVSIRRYDSTYWSTPVTNTPAPTFTLHDLSPLTLIDKYYSYDPNAGWITYNNGTAIMIPGMGYNVRAPQTFDINTPATFTAQFIGVPNNGNITVVPVKGKYNLIGNPYPSGLNAWKFVTDNNTGALYFWTHNTSPIAVGDGTSTYSSTDYATYNKTGSTAAGGTLGNRSIPSDFIGAGQAFFMIASSNNPITFTNDMRLGPNNTDFFKTSDSKTEEKSRLWLNFTNKQGAFKQALIGYIEGATNNWDNNYDGITISGNSFIDFYSINGTSKLTIQGRALPFDDSDLVPFGYVTKVEGEFTIAIDHADGLFDTQAVYLEDKKTGTITDLRASNYTFTTAIGTFADRFVLRYTNKTLGTGDFENVENGLLVSVKDKVIKVTSAKEAIKEVTIFDISGKLLYNKKKVGNTELQIPNLQASDEVLLVKVILDNESSTTKKIIFQ